MSAIHDKRDSVNRVKIYRQEKGLSQQALAQAVNVSRQTINLLENQDYNPTLALAIRIARALDSDLNTLFWEDNHGGDDDEPTA